MTRQEALAYDNVLKDKLKLAAEMLGMRGKQAQTLWNDI